MKQLTWLHISDIHFNAKTKWRDSRSRKQLLELLKCRLAEDQSLFPDLIFCTGDIAFGEMKECSLDSQYEEAKHFFGELLTVCSPNGIQLGTERLFVVPGNHDIARSKINKDAQSTLIEWAVNPAEHVRTINQRFGEKTLEFRDAAQRLDEYGKFIKDYLPHIADENGRHLYAKEIEINGTKIGIAGFNSSWSCSGPEDDRNIWMAANWQFNELEKLIENSDIKIGLIHHPIDWLNLADRQFATTRIASQFDFWLHGHSHDAWITPIQSHIVIAAGAVGASENDEFGINLTQLDLENKFGVTTLFSQNKNSTGWIKQTIEPHAPNGSWKYSLPHRLNTSTNKLTPQLSNKLLAIKTKLQEEFECALRSFPDSPEIWIEPTLSNIPETTRDQSGKVTSTAKSLSRNIKSTIIKAPPQFGLTCLARYIILEHWQNSSGNLLLYLDAENIKPHNASIEKELQNQLDHYAVGRSEIYGIVLDSWSVSMKDSLKILKKVSEYFPSLPIICMERQELASYQSISEQNTARDFDQLFYLSLTRQEIRKIVCAYNDERSIGDENDIVDRIISDLDVLNLHRTAYNCLTLLKVSEVDFDENPVNRSEVIKRVLFLLFNTDDIPTYKSIPDLKDCEFVLGYFCEILIREGNNIFSRDRFLSETQKFCQKNLIDLETSIVFDILVKNHIINQKGTFFSFKVAYWIFYFSAQRMHHDKNFADFIFADLRYAQHPEIIEYYTGIDRKREDALQILIRDLKLCREKVRDDSGLPEEFNPYDLDAWTVSDESKNQMLKVISEGVQDSNLPSEIKDKYADVLYDNKKPYQQEINNYLVSYSFLSLMQSIRAGSRALRNSDYVHPDIKKELMSEILLGFEQVTKILLVILPILATKGHATYDGAGFVLGSDFQNDPAKRFMDIFCMIPYNVVTWFKEDLYSHKMGPLLIDQFSRPSIGSIEKHELISLLVYKRPRNWEKKVESYIASCKKDSFYLLDLFNSMRNVYEYGFCSKRTLAELSKLIQIAATKHITGIKSPSMASVKSAKLPEDYLPKRIID